MFVSLVTAAHVFICVVLIAIVLLQQGKGADMGATFGGGGQTVFGASGADNLLTRVTTGLAVAFMATSIYLALNAQQKVSDDGSLFSDAPVSAPASPAPTAPASTATDAPSDAGSEPSAARAAGSAESTSEEQGSSASP